MTNEASSGAQTPPDRIETIVPVNPATSALLGELRAIKLLLAEIRSNAERDEVPAPGDFQIPFQQSNKVRALQVQVFPATAGTYALKIGSNKRRTFATAANGALVFDFKQTIERGIRVAIVDDATGVEVTTAEIASAFITGYPE